MKISSGSRGNEIAGGLILMYLGGQMSKNLSHLATGFWFYVFVVLGVIVAIGGLYLFLVNLVYWIKEKFQKKQG
jgi:hypothetical protein